MAEAPYVYPNDFNVSIDTAMKVYLVYDIETPVSGDLIRKHTSKKENI